MLNFDIIVIDLLLLPCKRSNCSDLRKCLLSLASCLGIGCHFFFEVFLAYFSSEVAWEENKWSEHHQYEGQAPADYQAYYNIANSKPNSDKCATNLLTRTLLDELAFRVEDAWNLGRVDALEPLDILAQHSLQIFDSEVNTHSFSYQYP